jgi:endonuclease/exonuclease/phosphatase family metal-dependent hydrolase
LLVAALAAVATPTPTASASADIRLFQLNMCGRVCHWPTSDKVAAVVDAVAGLHPAAVSLNEACRAELSDVVAGVDSRGWRMSAAFMATRKRACADGSDFGNAVLTRAPIAAVDPLPYRAQAPDHHEFRGLLCVTADLGHRTTRICSTHLLSPGRDPGASVRRRQVAEAASVVGVSGVPVVLMGDFNLPPTDRALGRLYTPAHTGGAGLFDEIDQGADRCRCGAATQRSGEKIDYVFVTAGDFEVVDGHTTPATFSDHLALHGRIRTR